MALKFSNPSTIDFLYRTLSIRRDMKWAWKALSVGMIDSQVLEYFNSKRMVQAMRVNDGTLKIPENTLGVYLRSLAWYRWQFKTWLAFPLYHLCTFCLSSFNLLHSELVLPKSIKKLHSRYGVRQVTRYLFKIHSFFR